MTRRYTYHGHRIGGVHSPELACFNNIRARCSNPKNPRYPRYGARGIKVCNRWLEGEDGKSCFELFLADMGPRPTPQHTIERKDNDGNYEPSNCVWDTRQTQANNRATNRVIEIDGESRTLAEWSRVGGVRLGTAHARLKNGWEPRRAFNLPAPTS